MKRKKKRSFKSVKKKKYEVSKSYKNTMLEVK